MDNNALEAIENSLKNGTAEKIEPPLSIFIDLAKEAFPYHNNPEWQAECLENDPTYTGYLAAEHGFPLLEIESHFVGDDRTACAYAYKNKSFADANDFGGHMPSIIMH